ncbi:MAG: hypothetical protein JOZ18_19830 [Chloroflexi bacterium]|nr:hypothetical protein [Chloroflexota bacterium]
MKKFTKLIEGLLVPAIAMICLLVSLADFFGLFNLIPTSRIPLLTLLLVSLALSSLSFVQNKSAEAHQDVQRLLSKIEPEHMGKVLQQIDPRLRKVLTDDYFIDILEFFQTAVKESKIHLNDVARFRFYFIRTLQSHPKSVFLSTEPFLWRDPIIMDTIKQFIQNGGKIEQILFVKNTQELSSSAIEEVLIQQRNIGVKVHIVNGAMIPGDLKKHFIVEFKGKLAWETHLDGDGHAGSSMITTNKHLTASYCRIFEKLRESEIRK